jgi:hypothetical protein
MSKRKEISQALDILSRLGMPKAQVNERSALCLLSLLNLTPNKAWKSAESPLVGITPMMTFSRTHYKKKYAPNTRETFRRQTMHQFVAAGIALYNPDEPDRPVNSPNAVYQIEPELLRILKSYGTSAWKLGLKAYLSTRETLAQRYAKERTMTRVPVRTADGKELALSGGTHSSLIKSIIEDFASRFAPGGTLVYAGDTGAKWGQFDKALLSGLGVTVDAHGKMPDVVVYYPEKNWLILIEAVTSHGPVDGKRHAELATLFANSTAGLVYVTAFPSKTVMTRYLGDIAWETEVWVADSPTHLIHFNGVRFLGPHGG